MEIAGALIVHLFAGEAGEAGLSILDPSTTRAFGGKKSG